MAGGCWMADRGGNFTQRRAERQACRLDECRSIYMRGQFESHHPAELVTELLDRQSVLRMRSETGKVDGFNGSVILEELRDVGGIIAGGA